MLWTAQAAQSCTSVQLCKCQAHQWNEAQVEQGSGEISLKWFQAT